MHKWIIKKGFKTSNGLHGLHNTTLLFFNKNRSVFYKNNQYLSDHKNTLKIQFTAILKVFFKPVLLEIGPNFFCSTAKSKTIRNKLF